MLNDNWVLLGRTRNGKLVFQVAGGAPEDEGTEGDEGDEGEGDEDVQPEYTPPSADEWLRAQAALKRANSEAATRRHYLEQNGIDPRTGKRDDADDEEDAPAPKPAARKRKADDDEDEQLPGIDPAEFEKLQKARRTEGKAAARREAQLMQALSKNAATVALTSAGWNGNGAGVIEKMIDLSEIQIDDDGNVLGIDEQVLEIKNVMPSWFKQPRAKREKPAGSAADVDGGDKGSAPPLPETKSWLTRINDQIDGVE